MKSEVKWVEDLTFEGYQDGQIVGMTVGEPAGGRGRGVRPKGLLLTALGGCTAMDVVSILAKMRVPLSGFEVQVSAETGREHPKVFKAIHVRYVFHGKDLPMDKLTRAVTLSQERYCGVSAMLAKNCPVTWEIVLETPKR
jgi:putative redox protein